MEDEKIRAYFTCRTFQGRSGGYVMRGDSWRIRVELMFDRLKNWPRIAVWAIVYLSDSVLWFTPIRDFTMFF